MRMGLKSTVKKPGGCVKKPLKNLLICVLLLSTGLFAQPNDDADTARWQKTLENQREDQKRT